MHLEIKEVLAIFYKNKSFYIILFIFLSNILTFVLTTSFQPKEVTSLENYSEDVVVNSSESKLLAVDVSGAVKYPGVYLLPEFSRVNDALALSGGLLENSSSTWVQKNLNLAQSLKDSQKIYIPFESDNEYVCKRGDINTLAFEESYPTNETNNEESAIDQNESINTSNLIAINSATIDELDALPGIGPVYAGKIISERPFTNIDDIQVKTKIPQSTLNKISTLISYE